MVMYDPTKLGVVQYPAAPGRNGRQAWHGRVAIVGGCGHVGLPLGMALARAGLRVGLFDTSAERVDLVRRRRMPFNEDGADELLPELVESGRLQATTDASGLAEAEAVIVTIGTPVADFCDPAIGEFDRAMEAILARMRPGQLLVLRSTVFPGVTDWLARKMRAGGRGGIDLAFCPERILQQKSLDELVKLPQLIGVVTPSAAVRAAELFGLLSPKVIFMTPVEAELAKLFCNAYRYINFAISNQFYQMACRHRADFQRIYDAVREDYPRMGAFARPGFAAGPCLVKDTCQLGAFDHGGFPLGQAALEVNEGMPCALVQSLQRSYDLKDMRVGILGMAFKAESDDPRDSLSYKLRKVLLMECKEVLCTDPYVPDPRLLPLAEVIDRADLLIIATPHGCYRNCKFPQPVIDITQTVPGAAARAPAGDTVPVGAEGAAPYTGYEAAEALVGSGGPWRAHRGGGGAPRLRSAVLPRRRCG
jgi:UDP-N-acetyl-D-mannosaminuronic acid dehydrogenase